MKRLFALLGSASLWLGVAASTEASFQNYFPALRTEVSNRIVTLSGIPSPTPTQKTQLKSLGSALKAIDKSSTTLAGDLKNLASVASALNGSFGADVTLSNLLRTCVGNYAAYCQTQLDPLNAQINALAAGPLKDAANTARLAAQAIVTQAGSGSPFAGASGLGGFTKALSSAQKAITKAQKKGGGGGGGGGGNGLSATITRSGTNDNWVASSEAGAEWVQHSGILDVGGNRGVGHLSVALCSGFNGAPGTYALTAGCGGYSEGLNFSGIISGTITITAINAASHTISGTFSYTADGGITVSNGQFNLTNLIVTP